MWASALISSIETIRLQSGAVDDLHVNGELTTVVVENKDADGATAGLEGIVKTSPKVGLVNNWERLLDITLEIVLVWCFY
jgi:hypothetical protein